LYINKTEKIDDSLLEVEKSLKYFPLGNKINITDIHKQNINSSLLTPTQENILEEIQNLKIACQFIISKKVLGLNIILITPRILHHMRRFTSF
jgi:hypothetical protein